MNFGYAFVGASLATSVCHPLDVARVRVMVAQQAQPGQGSNWVKEMYVSLKTKGPASLWTGLSAGLLRQAFYGTSRFGCFETLQDFRVKQKGGGKLTSGERFLFGCLAGGVAGLAGNPADVALTRMASDNKLPSELKRHYRNGVDAMLRIGREDGLVKGLLRGAWTNVQRSVLVNGVMLGTYAQSRELFQTQLGAGTSPVLLQFLAGTTSGFATAVFAVPADLVKTNLQHQVHSTTALQFVRKTLSEQGVLGLWRGFTPFFLKLAPHTTITFMVIEFFKARFP